MVQVSEQCARSSEIMRANHEAAKRLQAARPYLIDIQPALQVIPRMKENTILHAGPPIAFEDMCGAMHGAVLGALIYEGYATTPEEAFAVARSGEIEFSSCNDHDAVGTMSGVISRSMPVFVVENKAFGNRSYCPINEGDGKVLQHGAHDGKTIERLRYIEKEFAPALRAALQHLGELDLQAITAESLHMGDEGHNRNKAATALFLLRLLPALLQEKDMEAVRRAALFISQNENFFINLSMAACKASLDPAQGIPYSTVVTVMARNGVEFGIKVSGLGEDQWFTGPCQPIMGVFYPNYTSEDANKDLGDSAITETYGLGGFAMNAAPAIVRYIGGTTHDARAYTDRMYEICVTENPNYTTPGGNFRGLPLGIDIRSVVDKKILPIINTAIANKNPGVGQIGAGIVTPPRECFEEAVMEFYDQYPELL